MEEKFGHKSKNRYDLNPDEEVLLCQWAKEEHDSDFRIRNPLPVRKAPVLREEMIRRTRSWRCRSTCCSAAWRSPPAVSVSTIIRSRWTSWRPAR